MVEPAARAAPVPGASVWRQLVDRLTPEVRKLAALSYVD
jgi:hypothetical protein